MRSETTRTGMFYGWWIVIAGGLAYAVLLGSFQTFGVFLKPIQAEFGWSRAVTSAAFFIGSITMAVLAPVVGWLSDRYGPRIVISAVAVSGAIGYSLASRVQNQWQLYGSFVLMGSGGTFFVPLLAVVSRWFSARRGLALGLTGIGGGVGQAVMSPLAQVLIDHRGWRQAYLILGIIVVVVVVSAVQILKGSPREVGLLPYGENRGGKQEARRQGAAPVPSFDLNQARHTRSFWLIVIAMAAGHFTYQMTWVHLAPYATDPGIGASAFAAASLLSVIGWSNVAGKVFMGNLCDRIGPRSTLIICYGASAAAMGWLLVAKTLWMLYLFSFVFGFFYGGLIPLQPALTASVFGLGSLGAISGAVQTGTSGGGAAGSVVGGWIYDITGSYNNAFILGAVLFVTSMTLVVLLAVRDRAIEQPVRSQPRKGERTPL